MLQQTTVTAVVPFWIRFLDLFPDVQALAAADESEVLAAWSGLGYYRRARNLHLAAGKIVREFGGEMPASRKQWQNLPGVGTYTSGAIASIGLAEPVPAVDANARRVLCRWFFDDPEEAARLSPVQLEELALRLVVPRCPGLWNEAVMELGAVVCRSDKADCRECPVVDHCAAGLAGTPLQIPPVKKRVPVTRVALAVVAVFRGSEVLLIPPEGAGLVGFPGTWKSGRDDTSDLHQGLWSLPSTSWFAETPELVEALDNPSFVLEWATGVLSELGGTTKSLVATPGIVFFHAITRYRLRVRVWEVHWEPEIPFSGDPIRPAGAGERPQATPGNIANQGRFVELLRKLPVSKLVSKALEPQRQRIV